MKKKDNPGIKTLVDSKQRKYIIGLEYTDKGKKSNPEDQFLSWINIENVAGIQNSSGIRVLNFRKELNKSHPAFIVLVTNQARSGSGFHNPKVYCCPE